MADVLAMSCTPVSSAGYSSTGVIGLALRPLKSRIFAMCQTLQSNMSAASSALRDAANGIIRRLVHARTMMDLRRLMEWPLLRIALLSRAQEPRRFPPASARRVVEGHQWSCRPAY